MRVAITGAAGKVGRVVSEGLPSHQITLFTHSEHEDIDSELLDGTSRDAFTDAMAGVDALVHLAWISGDLEEWTAAQEENIRMVRNALEAALENDLDRVVIASSSHAVGMYNRDDPSEFESTVEEPTAVIDTETPPRPDSTYGVAKVTTEALCSYYADRYGLDVVVLRIGWLMSRAELLDRRSDSEERVRFARAMWLSPRDCRALFTASLEQPLSESPVIGHGISRNAERYLTLTETMQQLGYRPRDDAATELEEAGEQS